MIQLHHQRIIAEELHKRGLTFKPLQIEMLDHICCDVESQMAEGMSFDAALQLTMESLGPEHFKQIQQDTMDAIQDRISTTRWVSYVGVFCLYASLCFKVLHLQYGGFLLAVSFGCFIASLLLPAVTGMKFDREKPGAIRVMAVVAGIALLLIGYTLRILGLPGGDWIILSAIATTLIALVVNTIYVYSHAKDEGNLLTFLHEKYSPGIERFLFILLIPAGVYKILSAFWHASAFPGDLILLIVIFASAIHLLVLFWRMLEQRPSLHSPTILLMILLSIGLFLPVFTGELVPMQIRIMMIVLYTTISAWLAWRFDGNGWIPSVIAVFVPVWFFVWAMTRLEIMACEFTPFLFNTPVLLVMVALVLLAPRNSALRTYMILSLSGYLFEFLRVTS